MAWSLTYRWPLDEGTGLTYADNSGKGNTGTILQVGGNPAWAVSDTGFGNCLRFTDAAFSQDSSPRAWAPHNYADCTLEFTGFTIVARFKSVWTARGARVIFGLISWDAPSVNDPLFRLGFYLSDTKKVYFGASFTYIYTHKPIALVSDAVLNDGQWHTLIGSMTPHFWHVPGGPYGVMRFWVDGVEQASSGHQLTDADNITAWGGGADPNAAHQWMIGMGRFNNTGTLVYFPDTVGSNSAWCGTFDGDIDQCEVWCGPFTQAPVDAWPETPLVATEYIGHCPNINDGNICVPRSNSRCRTGQSSSAVIVRTS